MIPRVISSAPVLGCWLSAYGSSGTASSRNGTPLSSASQRCSSATKPLSGVRTVIVLPLPSGLFPPEIPHREHRRQRGPRCHYSQPLQPRIYSPPAIADGVKRSAERAEL